MAFKDALLQLSSYPEALRSHSIEQAVLFAEVLGAHISALTFKIKFANAGNVLANALLDIPGMVAAERQKSAETCKQFSTHSKAWRRSEAFRTRR